MIEVRGLVKRYPTGVALDEVSLTLGAGEIVGLIGHNGAGKSTLIRILIGLARPTSGEVLVDGVPPYGRPGVAVRRRLGFLPEQVAFHPELTAAEMLRFYARLRGLDAGACDTWLERVGLAAVAGHRIGTFSKGMRQRLGLAQALLGEPRLLVLDEPASGLDPAFRRVFLDLLAQRRAAGCLVLVASHSLEEVLREADRLVVLREGRLLACDRTERLLLDARVPSRVRAAWPPGTEPPPIPGLDSLGAVERRANRLTVTCPVTARVAVLRLVTSAEPPPEHVDVPGIDLAELYQTLSDGALAA